jgi:GT2 family glycosyltransferase
LPRVSILIVNFNGREFLGRCLQSIERHCAGQNVETILVDNDSSDGSVEYVQREFPKVKVIASAVNLGFGAANNLASQSATGEYFFLLNSDAALTAPLFREMIGVISRDESLAVVAPRLVGRDGVFQLSTAPEISLWGETKAMLLAAVYRLRPSLLSGLYSNKRIVEVAVGAALFIPAAVYREYRGFNESFFMYFEESDLCKRLRSGGRKILFDPYFELIHAHGGSTAKVKDAMRVEYRKSQLLYYQLHRPAWEGLVLRAYLFIKFSIQIYGENKASARHILRLLFSKPRLV